MLLQLQLYIQLVYSQHPAIAQSKDFSDPNVFDPRTPGTLFGSLTPFCPASPWTKGILAGTRSRKWHTDLPQSAAELTATSALKNWKQPESRVQNVIEIYGATTGHRNSYRYDFKATSEVSVTDCDRHIYI